MEHSNPYFPETASPGLMEGTGLTLSGAAEPLPPLPRMASCSVAAQLWPGEAESVKASWYLQHNFPKSSKATDKQAYFPEAPAQGRFVTLQGTGRVSSYRGRACWLVILNFPAALTKIRQREPLMLRIGVSETPGKSQQSMGE